MEAGKRIITDIFNRARSLHIPFFQRAYVWKEANWERFLDDMLSVARTRRGYFLGSIILKQMGTSTADVIGDVRAVVDGQQRMTTLLIFFKVLCVATNRERLFRDTFHNFSGELILKHNHSDQPAFEAVLTGTVTDETRAKFPESKVLRALEYFESRKDLISEIDPLVLLGRVYFVGIDLSSDEDEQQIFDTINSLGVALSTAELLKNELFGRSDIALYERTWKSAFERDEATRQYWNHHVTAGRFRRENIDLFLQSFLLMHVDTPDEVKVDGLFGSYKDYLKRGDGSKPGLIRDLKDSADTYADSIAPDVLDSEIDGGDPLERLNVVIFGLSTTTVVPYVVYVLRKVPSAEERDRIFALLESYLMRRVVCQETTGHYNNVFSSLVRGGVDTHDALAERFLKSDDPSTRIPDDVMLLEGFLRSNLTNLQAKVVLYLLERSVRNDAKQATALSGFSHYSLEHLMPKKWRNYWGALPPDAAHHRDQALRKLGNLSLLSSSLNASIRDSKWVTKLNGARSRHGLLRYAQGLETLVDDLKLPEWNEGTIVARGQRLAAQACNVWRFPTVAV